MTCKDCIHYCLCKDTLADENWREDTPQEIKDRYSPKGCENFKNKYNFKEVKYGHWRKTTYVEVRRCSICNKPSNVSRGMPKYCPDCGAIMIKEKRK